MKKIILLSLLLLANYGFSQSVQEKYQRAKIDYSTSEDLSRLSALGIPIEHATAKKGHYIISDFSITELESARNAGFKVEILIEDSTAFFLQKNKNKTPLNNPDCQNSSFIYNTPTNFKLGSMGGYLTYQQVLDELDQMRTLYPNLITAKENISNFTTEGEPDASTTPSIGGNGIKWVKISDNPDSMEDESQILYTGVHHAREPNSMMQLIFYMWYLLENYETDPEIKGIVDNTELYFVPIVNPDGYLYNEKTNPNGGGFWRKNRKDIYGTDLNRNYNYYINGDPNNGVWGGEGSSGATSSDTYRGTAPFSEIETQAIKWFVENHNFVMAFNNHSRGDLLLYPYGYTNNAPTAENDLFVGVSAELVSQNGFSDQISSDLYPASGVSDDFMYGTVNTHDKIYSFTPEIGSEFWPASNQIAPIAKGMMYLNITAAKMTNNYASISDTGITFVGDDVNNDANFNLKRLGISGNGNFTVRLNAISANITSNGNPVAINNLELLESIAGSISYTLDNSVLPGDDIVYELILNNGQYDSALIINKKFGKLTTIFNDPANSVTDNFNTNSWGTTTSTFVSPSSSITDSPNGNYTNNANTTITLKNSINLQNALGATVSFNAKWNLEASYDYVQFEVSTNNGSTWIPQCGKFTSLGGSLGSQPNGQPLYDGNQNDWVLEEINLGDYLDENILVRFHLVSDGAVQDDGFYFDDLSVKVVLDPNLGLATNNPFVFSIYPNPVSEILEIDTELTKYSIEIFNLQGQLVGFSDNHSGNIQIDYSKFASGMFLMKITSENNSETYKIVKK